MRTSWKTELSRLALIAAMFALAALFWSSAPDRVPIHFDLSGQPDGYAGRFEGLLGVPLLALVFYLLTLFLPKVDPRYANYAYFPGVYLTIRAALLMILVLGYGFILLRTRGIEIEGLIVFSGLIGGLCVVLGILMDRIRFNWFFGIRTPWTLMSELSWTETHRLGGWLFVLMGFIFLASALAYGLIGPTPAIVEAPIFSAVAANLFLIVYSYLVWRRDPERSS